MKWKLLLETPDVSIYQKNGKTLIISNRGFTIQTDAKIIKRPRKEVKEVTIEVLVCPKCGAIHNPDTYNGLKCRKCGGRLVLTEFPQREVQDDDE